MPFPHRGRASTRRSSTRCSTARSSSRPRRSRRDALAGRTVALIFEQPSTRTRSSFEAGVFELGGHPMILRAEEIQLTRGESVGDVARVLSRHAAVIGYRTALRRGARGDGRARRGPRGQHALAEPPPVPGARRPADAARGARRPRAAAGSPTSATARTTWPARWRSWAASPGLRGRHRRARRLPARGRPRRGDLLRAGRGRRGRRRRSTPTSGCRCPTTRSPPPSAAARSRPTASTTRLLDQAADGAIALHCLPAHPGRGDLRRGPLRRPPAHLGPGREPPPRAEGAARAPDRTPTSLRPRCLSPRQKRALPTTSVDRARASACRRSSTTPSAAVA